MGVPLPLLSSSSPSFSPSFPLFRAFALIQAVGGGISGNSSRNGVLVAAERFPLAADSKGRRAYIVGKATSSSLQGLVTCTHTHEAKAAAAGCVCNLLLLLYTAAAFSALFSSSSISLPLSLPLQNFSSSCCKTFSRFLLHATTITTTLWDTGWTFLKRSGLKLRLQRVVSKAAMWLYILWWVEEK